MLVGKRLVRKGAIKAKRAIREAKKNPAKARKIEVLLKKYGKAK